MRSSDLWFRPIETRVGPDGALYVVDFYNQAVIHNDTRGPQHGPANAAVRPDRDHYFGRIWRVQHKQATKLDVPALESRAICPGLLRAMETSPNAHVKQTAWRLAQENFAVDPRLAQHQAADGQQGAGALRAARAARRPPPQRTAVLDTFAAADRQLDEVGDRRRRNRAGRRLRDRARSPTRVRQALADFVTAVLPAALPAMPSSLLVAAAAAGPAGVGAQGAVVRAVARMEGGTLVHGRPATTAGAAEAARRSCDDGGGAADRRAVGQGGRAAARAPSVTRALLLQRRAWRSESERRPACRARREPSRACRRAGRRRWPRSRRCSPTPAVSDALKARLVATLGESPAADVDAVMIAALARTELDADLRSDPASVRSRRSRCSRR